jgi:hypothetical protein
LYADSWAWRLTQKTERCPKEIVTEKKQQLITNNHLIKNCPWEVSKPELKKIKKDGKHLSIL